MGNSLYGWGLVKFRNMWADSLYRNSIWLMAGSFAMAVIGFVYWLIAARLYTPTEIGLTTTFLSVASLINSFSLLGFGTTLIRYLPNSSNKARLINSAFTIVVLLSLMMGVVFVSGVSSWTPDLIFIRSTIPVLIMVIVFFPLFTLNGITDSVFTAFRQSHWVFLSNITQSVVKLVALVGLTSLGVWGMIGSNMIATAAAVVLCLFLISTRFGVTLRPTFDLNEMNVVKKFTFGIYLSGIIGGLPNMILPIIITNGISAAQTAFFNIPNMIVGILMLVPAAISKSYFTESSHSGSSISMRRPILVTYGVVLPIVAFLFLFGKFLLGVFGEQYAVNGYPYLQLTLLSTLNYVAIYFFSNRLMLRNRMSFIVRTQVVSTILLLSLVYLLLPKGIVGVGYASVITSTMTVGIYLYNYFFSTKAWVRTG